MTVSRNAISAVLLGPPHIEFDGGSESFLPERRFQLIAYLAHRGDWVSRDSLASLFWPDQDNPSARRNLRFVLHSAGQLSQFDTLEAERDRVRLSLSTDVRAFEAAVRASRWAQAIALYRGPFCAGLEIHASAPFAEWLALERGRLAEMYRTAAMEKIASSEPIETIAIARGLLEQDPLDEQALRACLRALHALDRGAEAKRMYREFAERLMEELGLEPSGDTRKLVRELADRGPPPHAPLSTESTFIGRTSEMQQMASLLAQPDCRLLTLIGAGGVGKSRLAKEFAATDETATLVRLHELTVPGQLPAHVARAVGAKLSPKQDAADQVQALIGARRCLLVLDNFEHIIDAGALLTRWLAHCPGLRIIVTSREKLDVPGEWLLRVEGLEFPHAADHDIARFDGIKLFVERAAAIRPSFDAEVQLESIADIVARVEGMPLAIELAAAWVALLPCAVIARELRANLELLQTSDTRRGQRTVQGSCEHSWQLLTARERTLFTNVSVFRGGFAAEAARHVTRDSLPAIAQLVDKSLVRVDGRGRFSLHPLLQQFAAEKLQMDSAAAIAARRRHAEFYTHWLRTLGDFRAFDQKTAIAQLDTDIDNCLAAWHWAVESQRGDLIQAAALALIKYFEYKGELREGLECFTAADSLRAAEPAAIGMVERGKATLLLRLGRYDAAEASARRSLQQFRFVSDHAGIRSALTLLGLANWERARYARARLYFADGLKRALADDDTAGAATFQMNLALVAKADGRYDEAATLLGRAVELCRKVGDTLGCITALNNLGNLYRSLKQPSRGRAPLLEALALTEDSGARLAQPFVLLNLALVELELGEAETAHDYCGRALDIVGGGADRQIEVGCHATLARVELLRGNAERARAYVRDSARLARVLDHMPLMLGAAVNLAGVLLLEARPDDAAAVLHMVRAHRSAGQPDRDDADRELARIEPLLSRDALEQARARGVQLPLDDVIAEAMSDPPRTRAQVPAPLQSV